MQETTATKLTVTEYIAVSTSLEPPALESDVNREVENVRLMMQMALKEKDEYDGIKITILEKLLGGCRLNPNVLLAYKKYREYKWGFEDKKEILESIILAVAISKLEIERELPQGHNVDPAYFGAGVVLKNRLRLAGNLLVAKDNDDNHGYRTTTHPVLLPLRDFVDNYLAEIRPKIATVDSKPIQGSPVEMDF